MDIDLGDVDLPNNILKFGYGINYKYMGKVSHSFDRFYIVTKFELPKLEDLKFDDIPYDNKVDLQQNKIFHLEDSMVMYGINNSDTLEDLIDTVHKLLNRTAWNENYFQNK